MLQQRLLVLGGSGYVGQNLCRTALDSGNFAAVQSLSRSGRPSHPLPCIAEKEKQVEWLEGDIFDDKCRDRVLQNDDVNVVISTIGAFGSNEFMERICGDATVAAVQSAVQHGVSRFGFISSAQVRGGNKMQQQLSPSFPLYGYFRGKEKAEEAIREAFPDAHVILRPGFIYGPRRVGHSGRILPLQLVGAPIHFVSTQLGPVSSLIQSIPFVGTECSSMVPVHAVAKAMIEMLTAEPPQGVTLSAEEIRKFG